MAADRVAWRTVRPSDGRRVRMAPTPTIGIPAGGSRERLTHIITAGNPCRWTSRVDPCATTHSLTLDPRADGGSERQAHGPTDRQGPDVVGDHTRTGRGSGPASERPATGDAVGPRPQADRRRAVPRSPSVPVWWLTTRDRLRAARRGPAGHAVVPDHTPTGGGQLGAVGRSRCGRGPRADQRRTAPCGRPVTLWPGTHDGRWRAARRGGRRTRQPASSSLTTRLVPSLTW